MQAGERNTVERRRFTLNGRQLAAIVGVVAFVAALVPVGAGAAGETLVHLVDGDGTSKAQVDNGKVRIGDGSGPVTVNGTVESSAVQVLAKGNCNDGAGNARVVTLANAAGLRITGIFLGATKEGYATGKLAVTAPGDAEPMINLLITNGPAFDERHASADFGSGLVDPDSGNWVFQCATHSGSGAAWGSWIVYGR